MRQLLLILLTLSLFSCNTENDNTKILQKRIDSLETKLADTYKPGFGDFMGTMQTHHSKLWFAGQNKNWDLADFEVHELEGTIENILKYQAGRKESQLIETLSPALDSIENAIDKKDYDAFEKSYRSLTIACNTCHKATGYEFNRVKIPEISTWSNQDFSPLQ
ncbi:hypothetical protein [Bizionia paragorgiae]|uniref:hypothetical protein n=1 Tax=Bizionia paragorgiae TaxID=283786 RepID=UPI00299E0885|nr:hypothetical protein [Bizionia paragorgiae]MDX1270872.1 hypothetical protein [Bizionia paragorgiae]